MHNNISVIQEYFQHVTQAQSETAKKELFQTLLHRLFPNDAEISSIINEMNLGAERTIFNIPLKQRVKVGRADTQYNNVIIEWEKNLEKTGKHAQEQLIEYVGGNWLSGAEYDFTLIATDGIVWKIYAPNYEKIVYLHKDMKDMRVEDIALKQSDDFKLQEENFAEFPFFIDRYLFRTEIQAATLKNVQLGFGETSAIFLHTMTVMKKHHDSFKNQVYLQVAYGQWQKFLEIAYGSKFADSHADSQWKIFFIHTYLSVFSKIVAYTIVSSSKSYISEEQLHTVLKGTAFKDFAIERFVENDFFYWVTEKEHFQGLKSAFRKITMKIMEYDFSKVQEDVLKGIYQELIDIETRHALGEYYTPDWLCEKIVKSLPIQRDSRILDPACGSGSFLRAAIVELRQKFPELSVKKLTNQVVGIDIHPLSVQISKTTILLAIHEIIDNSKDSLSAKEPFSLNVHLANSLLVPEGTADILGTTFNMVIDETVCSLNMSAFTDFNEFDEIISVCNQFVNYFPERIMNHVEFQKALIRKFENNTLFKKNIIEYVNSFYSIYKALQEAKSQGRDSIWSFILQNNYKPVFLKQSFDFVIGNPPWLTYAGVTNVNYQNALYILAQNYALTSTQANAPHLEIAAIFLAHSTSYFLKSEGILSFILPRSFLTADQHENTRSGKAKGFKLTEIWDLKDVSVLFNVPSCVIFAQRSSKQHNPLSKEGIQGFEIKGKIKFPDLCWEEVKDLLDFTEKRWFYSQLSKQAKNPRSALTTTQMPIFQGSSYYAPFFKLGATIIPRSFYFIRKMGFEGGLIQFPMPDDADLRGRILYVETNPTILRDAKKPWKSLTLKEKINTDFLFRTALAKNIVPFSLVNPALIILPILIKEDNGLKIELLEHFDILLLGYIETAIWFKKAEELWNKYKTQKSVESAMTLNKRLDFQKGLTGQNLNTRYLVIYTASAKDANAVIVDRKTMAIEFIIESAAYWFATDNLKEAHYLVCFLNCNYSNQLIKAFQSRGLFGPRHICKKILDIPLPQFDSTVESHQKLAELGELCEIKTKEMLGNTKDLDLTTYELGRLRRKIRQNLDSELKAIDELVKKILEKTVG